MKWSSVFGACIITAAHVERVAPIDCSFWKFATAAEVLWAAKVPH